MYKNTYMLWYESAKKRNVVFFILTIRVACVMMDVLFREKRRRCLPRKKKGLPPGGRAFFAELTAEKGKAMRLRGIQKTTLLDFPGRVACTVFTGGCNFRCPFCHNASLIGPGEDLLSEEAFFAFLDRRRGILDGVCVTGGEPLLHTDIAPFLQKIKDRGFLVKLDTNGSFPDRLKALCRAGLVDYVAMDVKNSREKYPETAGVSAAILAGTEESIAFLLEGSVPYEFRTTLVGGLHTVADIASIAARIRGAERYFLQMFVDSGDVLENGLGPVPREEARQMLAEAQKVIPGAALRGI